MKKIVFAIVAFGLILVSCSDDEITNDEITKPIPNDPIVEIKRDTVVSLQNDFSAICMLESGFTTILGVKKNSISADTSKVSISQSGSARLIKVNDYFSSKDKRQTAPNVFRNILIKLGFINKEKIGWSYNVYPTTYYEMHGSQNILFEEYLFKAGVANNFSNDNLRYKEIKLGNYLSYSWVKRKTFGERYVEYISTEEQDGTDSFNGGYKVFFSEKGYIIFEFVTCTGIETNGNVINPKTYTLKFKIIDKVI